MRTFIAIPLPDPVHDYIKRLQNRLKKAGADVKWVAPAHAHLTLKFLGEIDDPAVETVTRAMREACKGIPAFCMSLSKPGGFPSSTSPRVIWVGISDGMGQAQELAKNLEQLLAPLGKKEDRPFAAHITIGRTRSSRNRKELALEMEKAAQTRCPPDPFAINHITLYKSTLSPTGPTYTPLFKAPLD